MKKHLREELIALAQKILRLNQQEELDTKGLKEATLALYEKLTVLDFTEKSLSFAGTASEGEKGVKPAPPKKEVAKPEDEDSYDYAPDGTQYNDSEAITEPNTEKIKDIVAQMEPETEQVDKLIGSMFSNKFQKNDKEDIGGVHFDHLPQFEPVNPKQESPKPRSLNDRLKKSFQIGFNDRHAFVKHLFEGSDSDYNRVLSQLNTLKTKEEAFDFVLNMVKPDYNNWEGKELFENRFLNIIEKRFQ